MVVGPHGAGLGNLIWADAPCSIVEIFPHAFFNDCFARLAITVGFEYDYVECDLDPVSGGTIPVDAVMKKVASILERSGYAR